MAAFTKCQCSLGLINIVRNTISPGNSRSSDSKDAIQPATVNTGSRTTATAATIANGPMSGHYGDTTPAVTPTYGSYPMGHYAATAAVEHFNHASNSSNSSDQQLQHHLHHHQQQQQQQAIIQQQQQQQQHHQFDLAQDSVLAAATLINQLSPQEPTYVNL